MIPLPPDLQPFRKIALELIREGNVRALEFSGRTYQANVYDPRTQESYWAFIHLTEQGEISDSFCSCSDETDADDCHHIAAGFLKIYNEKNEPLHKRYEKSFWRELGMILDARYGSKASKAIKGKNKEGEAFLKELFKKNVAPTEENSLKFSDLSEEELEQVRKGKLSEKLHYEFSFWSDLAKALLFIQENKDPIEIHFHEDKKGLPLELVIDTEDLQIKLLLTEKELVQLIPKLMTVKTSLKVRGGFQDRVQKAHFDQEKGSLILAHSNFDPKKVTGIPLKGWIYKKDDGFFRIEGDPKILKGVITSQEMEGFLSEYYKKLGDMVHPGVYECKGELRFDNRGRLVLTHYLFNPGDLSKDNSWKFGKWVWLKDSNFYRVLYPKDLPPEGVVPEKEVYEWVLTHQAFLNTVEGFKVHLKAIESTLSWKVDEKGSLSFKSSLKGDFSATPKDYGSLVWVKGQGFFSRASFQEALAIQAGNEIPQMNVASYIRRNEAELRLVPGFFMRKSPLEKAGLKIKYVNGKVQAVPQIDINPEFKHQRSRFYDEYLYIENEGFYHLSDKYFIPSEWREERIIPSSDYPDFFGKTLEKMAPYIIEIDPQLKPTKKAKLVYEQGLYFEAEGRRLEFGEFLGAYRSGKRFFFSSIGRFDFQDKRFEVLGNLFKKSRYPEVSLMELFKLSALEDLQVNFEDFKKTAPLDITGLKSQLRPYQETGLKWLWSLYCNDLSGLLCDDMGLGKTHQAMALLAACRNNSKKPLKFLVVCPTSVLYHWQEKLEQFLPTLKVVVFHGLKRSLKQFEEGEGVLLTSYGILRNEIDALKGYDFDVAIFDEVQLAKNHQSRLWSSLKELKARMLLGLTGTPIENHLRELKSLFDIVLPQLMPPEPEFIRLFVKPIERDESATAKNLLHRYTEPFLLRRKKEEVLSDLPEKTEEISHTDLAPSQRRLYHEVLESARRGVIQDLLDDKKIIPYIHIFALLSSLKKICDHPALYLKKIEDYKKYHSGKWELFLELIQEAINSEQKVVVFSHFLGMLDIIEAHLESEGIGFSSLRGSTTNRREMIERFQKDPTCKVFVASLQAGGLGIDLTSASVVIHYDRWWNAARENQATDRVHRIGQTRGVQVFKLVTLGTVEERIHALIEKKQKRMEEIVGSDEAQVIKTLTRDELIEIFQDDPLNPKVPPLTDPGL